MKKLILSAAALFAFGLANAQDATTTDASAFGFVSGDIFIEGNLSYNSNSTTVDATDVETTTSTFAFNPRVGYFISDDFAIGLSVSVGSGKTEVDGDETSKSTNFGAGAFARYYFLDLGQRFKTYSELAANYNSSTTGVDEEFETNGFGVGLGLGLHYFVTPKMAINFGLANVLSYNTTSDDADNSSNSFNMNVNVFNNFFDTPTFGLTYKF